MTGHNARYVRITKTATIEKRTEYRILSRAPGASRFSYRHFKGSSHYDHDRVVARMAERETESPGWTYKLQARDITTISDVWADA